MEIPKNKELEINWTKYRLFRVIDKTSKSIHHIIWRCNRMKYNTNAKENKVVISDREHIALNNFFKDKQDPRSQLIKVFELVKPVLSEWVKKELHTILYEADDELFYIPEVLKHKKK